MHGIFFSVGTKQSITTHEVKFSGLRGLKSKGCVLFFCYVLETSTLIFETFIGRTDLASTDLQRVIPGFYVPCRLRYKT